MFLIMGFNALMKTGKFMKLNNRQTRAYFIIILIKIRLQCLCQIQIELHQRYEI